MAGIEPQRGQKHLNNACIYGLVKHYPPLSFSMLSALFIDSFIDNFATKDANQEFSLKRSFTA